MASPQDSDSEPGIKPGERSRVDTLREFPEREVWPQIPEELRGKPISQEEQDEILGYGPNGYCEERGDFSLTDLPLVRLEPHDPPED